MSANSDTNTNCFYHPERPAMETCTECSQPICLGCQKLIAGKTVCQHCVSAIRQRVAGEMAPSPGTTPAAPPAYPAAPYAYASQPDESGVPHPYEKPLPYHTEAMGIKHVFGGFGLGFLAGIGGLVAWLVIVSLIHVNVAFFAIGLGWLIGVATTKGAGGRGGNVVAIMSALLAFFFCGIGFVMFLGDGAAWDWIFGIFCLFFGVQQAYKTPINAEKHW